MPITLAVEWHIYLADIRLSEKVLSEPVILIIIISLEN